MTSPLSQHPYPVDDVNRPASLRLPLLAQVKRHAELALRLSAAIDTVSSIQWQPALYDGTGRAAIGHADPAGETAASPVRLQLRAKVIAAEVMLERTARALERCLLDLEAAADKHQGPGEPADPDESTPTAA